MDDSDLWTEILAAAAFVVPSTYHTTKVKSPVQLVFGRDMILPINHVADWRYIRQLEQAQIYKYGIHENSTRTVHAYIVVDQVITITISVYTCKTPIKGLILKIFTLVVTATVCKVTGLFVHV